MVYKDSKNILQGGENRGFDKSKCTGRWDLGFKDLKGG